ncbi:MAG: Mrp/NBP35 family ATP-binding protein [Cellulosilyticaceae bacterium]
MSNCNTCPSHGSCSKDQAQCGIENNPHNNIKHVIGVMSGKGGVGKSSMSVMIAKELCRLGYKVGILDADITGPSVPRLLQLGSPMVETDGQNMIPPVSKEGIKVMSLNLLIDEETQPVVWRGPVIAGVIKQFWNEVIWGELDYLVIDMPPGTGDVPLTVGQAIPVSGMVMVSVPQDFISMIVAKSVHMVKKLNIPILGVIENMSYIACPDCDKKIKLYEGEDTQSFLASLDLELLGEIPMVRGISNLSVHEAYEDERQAIMSPIVKRILEKL